MNQAYVFDVDDTLVNTDKYGNFLSYNEQVANLLEEVRSYCDVYVATSRSKRYYDETMDVLERFDLPEANVHMDCGDKYAVLSKLKHNYQTLTMVDDLQSVKEVCSKLGVQHKYPCDT